MITAKKALDAVVSSGLATSYKKTRSKEYGHTATYFNLESDQLSVSNETYGKKSFLYFRCKSEDVAWKLVEILKRAGCNPGLGWNGGPASGCVELQVSYFKGHHWYE